MCTGAVVYTWAVQLFDTSALIAVARYCPPSGWLTNIQWGLWPLIEWVGALSSLVFLVSRPCTLYTSCYATPCITDMLHAHVVLVHFTRASLL